jgi:nucleoside-diphosphate-sugar epimerase
VKPTFGKVVILGATGLVGRECALALQHSGIEIIAPTREDFSIDQNALTIESSLREIMMNNPIIDTIHLNATSSELLNSRNYLFPAQIATFLEGRSALIPYLHFSSGGVYGGIDELIRDDTPVNPLNSQAKMKLAAEENCREIFPSHKILRLFFAYGVSQRVERLIPRMIRMIKAGQPIKCNDDGGPLLSITDVRDVARVSLELILNPWIGTRNLAGGETIKIAELANLIGKILNTPPIFDVNPISEKSLYAEPYDPGPWISIRDSEVLLEMCKY